MLGLKLNHVSKRGPMSSCLHGKSGTGIPLPHRWVHAYFIAWRNIWEVKYGLPGLMIFLALSIHPLPIDFHLWMSYGQIIICNMSDHNLWLQLVQKSAHSTRKVVVHSKPCITQCQPHFKQKYHKHSEPSIIHYLSSISQNFVEYFYGSRNSWEVPV